MRNIGSILIIMGSILFVFVAYAKMQTNVEQQKLAKEFTALTFATEKTEASSAQPKPQNGDPIGMLIIPKIDLKTPIVEGAAPENIKYAVGHLPSSGTLNGLGKTDQNFAIAGHRSYTYGQFFNRLDELAKGNQIILTTKNKEYTYKIYDKKIVKPTDVEVIYPVKGKSIITLITCHPKHSNKQRLIVFAELE